MILKILLVIAVIAIVYFMFIKKKPLGNSTKKKNADKTPPTSDMIECASCGTYVELSDAIISANKYYCSDECIKG